MRMCYLKSLVFSFLVLLITAIGCGKNGSVGSSSQPAASDPFLGAWNDVAGYTLTISKPDYPPIFEGYNYKVQFTFAGGHVEEPCKLTDSTSLTCYAIGASRPDTVVYNSNDSTVTLTSTLLNETGTIFYQPEKVPKDPAAHFLHTFTNGSTGNTIKISNGFPYDIQCKFKEGSAEEGAVSLKFSLIDENTEEVKNIDTYGSAFRATYDIPSQTLTIKQDKICYIPSGTTFVLSK